MVHVLRKWPPLNFMNISTERSDLPSDDRSTPCPTEGSDTQRLGHVTTSAVRNAFEKYLNTKYIIVLYIFKNKMSVLLVHYAQ